MRNIILGFAIVGAMAVLPEARAAVIQQSMIQRVDDCGPRCQEHRREVREQEERERRREREEHRRSEEHHEYR